MSPKANISEEILKKQSDELVESISDFTKELPNRDFSELAQRLNSSVYGMSRHIESSFHGERKIDQIRSWIKLSIALKECRDTLDLIAKLKYANPQELLVKLDNFNQMLIAKRQNQ
jgi:prefoldin subunit 5